MGETTSRPWPARLPFYYGWVNVGVAAVAMTATLPGRTYGLGLIKTPLCAELGIDDLRFSHLNFLAIVLGAALCLPVGRLIDRAGVRLTLAGVAAALGASVLAMSRAGDEAALFAALTLVRGLGQGALSVVAIAPLGKWFRRRVGPAMGVFTVLLAVGFGTVPLVGDAVGVARLAAGVDGVGLALLFGLAPLGWLLARNSPEACGVPADEPAAENEGTPARSTSVWAALRTPAFWVCTVATSLFNLVLSAVTLDSETLLTEHGLDGRTANGTVLGVLMVSGLPVNLLAGWLARRRPIGKLLAVGIAALAASLVAFPAVSDLPTAVGYAALLGASGGVVTVVFFAVYGHSYGRRELGAIQTAAQLVSVLASASGPVLLSLCRGWAGGTDPFFYGSAAAAVVMAVLAWRVRPPGTGG